MKKIFLTGVLLGVLFSTQATTITSTIQGTGALDGTYAYLWNPGITVPTGEQITSASISFNNIDETLRGNGNDISIDFGSISKSTYFTGTSGTTTLGALGSLPGTGNNSTKYADNDATGDAFGKNLTTNSVGSSYKNAYNLGTMSFGSLKLGTVVSQTFKFSTNELAALNSYIPGLWAFEIDPDCHFDIGSICFTYTVGPTNNVRTVPDAPATAGLLVIALLGMFVAHRKFMAISKPASANASAFNGWHELLKLVC